ncbi:mannose-1-phosphate guanylyltransferase/mannose-6-phosphate isomerase, partial [Yersinia pestis PY-42]
MIIFICI